MGGHVVAVVIRVTGSAADAGLHAGRTHNRDEELQGEHRHQQHRDAVLGQAVDTGAN